MGLVTLVTSGKGGVGKSTVTAGVATALARRGKRVLVVDCDFGLRSLDHILGVAENMIFDLSDIIAKKCEPLQAIYPCKWQEGLYLLPAPRIVEAEVSAKQMKTLITFLTKYFDHIFMDSPAGLGSGFIRAATPATRAIVITTPDPVCTRDAQLVRETLAEIENIRQMRMVINRFHPKLFKKIDGYTDLDQVIDTAGIQLLGVIPEDTTAAAAALSGAALSSKSAAVYAFTNIAARLDGEAKPLMNLKRVKYK